MNVAGWILSNLSLTSPFAGPITLTATATTRDGLGDITTAVVSEALTLTAAATPLPQLPGLFAGYAVRPPWQVAGVDYGVGVSPEATLRDPVGLSTAGVDVDGGSHIVRLSGDNVTLSGYDFSLDGGWTIYVTGTNDIIEGNNFKVGSNNLVPINAAASATNLAVLNNTIDGGGLGVAGDPSAIWSLISDQGTGLTVKYNYLENAPQHIVEFASGTLTDEYNLVENVGYYASAHNNDVQFYGGVATNSVISFNTIYNPPHAGQPTFPGEGLQVEAQGGATVSNTRVDNNTVISPGELPTNSYLIAIHELPGWTDIVDGVTVQSNYLDSSGAYGPIYPSLTGSNLAFGGNVDLVTGALIAAPSGTMSVGPSDTPPDQTVTSPPSTVAPPDPTTTVPPPSVTPPDPVVTSPYAGRGDALTIPEGTAFTDAVATFTDANATDSASEFTATIAWGDGTASDGTISGGNGMFSLSGAGGHVYADEGSYAVLATVTHTADQATFAMTGSATATDADAFATVSAPSISAHVGVAFGGWIARFINSNLTTPISDLMATIDWGDGTTSTGTLAQARGSMMVAGNHTYGVAGSDVVGVTIGEINGTAAGSAIGTAFVAGPLSPAW